MPSTELALLAAVLKPLLCGSGRPGHFTICSGDSHVQLGGSITATRDPRTKGGKSTQEDLGPVTFSLLMSMGC